MKFDELSRECYERLARLEEQNKSILEMLSSMDKAINGNGHPGLKARVSNLENQNSCVRRFSSDIATWAAIIVAILGVIAAFKR